MIQKLAALILVSMVCLSTWGQYFTENGRLSTVTFEDLKNPDTVIERVKRCLEVIKENNYDSKYEVSCYTHLGHALMLKEDYSAAIEVLTKAVDMNPATLATLYRATVYVRTGDYVNAARDLSTLTQNNHEIYEYVHEGYFSECVEMIALHEKGALVESFSVDGIDSSIVLSVLLEAQEYEKAADLLNSMSKTPKYAMFAYFVGFSLFDAKNDKANGMLKYAIDEFRKALDINCGDNYCYDVENIHLIMGHCYEMLGNTTEAVNEYEQIVCDISYNPWTKDRIKRLKPETASQLFDEVMSDLKSHVIGEPITNAYYVFALKGIERLTDANELKESFCSNVKNKEARFDELVEIFGDTGWASIATVPSNSMAKLIVKMNNMAISYDGARKAFQDYFINPENWVRHDTIVVNHDGMWEKGIGVSEMERTKIIEALAAAGLYDLASDQVVCWGFNISEPNVCASIRRWSKYNPLLKDLWQTESFRNVTKAQRFVHSSLQEDWSTRCEPYLRIYL